MQRISQRISTRSDHNHIMNVKLNARTRRPRRQTLLINGVHSIPERLEKGALPLSPP